MELLSCDVACAQFASASWVVGGGGRAKRMHPYHRENILYLLTVLAGRSDAGSRSVREQSLRRET